MSVRQGPATLRLYQLNLPEELYVCLGDGDAPFAGEWNTDQMFRSRLTLEKGCVQMNSDRDLEWWCDEFLPVKEFNFLIYTAPGKKWANLLYYYPVVDNYRDFQLRFGQQVRFVRAEP